MLDRALRGMRLYIENVIIVKPVWKPPHVPCDPDPEMSFTVAATHQQLDSIVRQGLQFPAGGGERVALEGHEDLDHGLRGITDGGKEAGVGLQLLAQGEQVGHHRPATREKGTCFCKLRSDQIQTQNLAQESSNTSCGSLTWSE